MEHLPIWLRNLPLPARPTSGTPAADAGPAWLREDAQPPAPRAGASAGAAADDTPDWLRELQSEVAPPDDRAEGPPAGRTPPEGEVPGWLRDAQPAAPAAPGRATPFGATSWLDSLVADSQADDQANLQAAPEPPPTTTTSRIKMPVGATDWLRSIGQESDPNDEPRAARSPAPEPPEDDKSGVPDWLRDVSADDMASAAAAEEAQGPSWLADEADRHHDASTVSSDWLGAADDSAETMAAEQVPDWLRDVEPVSFDAPAPSARPRDPGSVPDWLNADDSGDESARGSLPDVPDWLRDAESASSPAPDDDVPAWLRDAEPAPPAPAAPIRTPAPDDDVPAWLRDAEPAPPAPAPARAPTPDDDVPAWLRDAELASTEPAPNRTPDDVPAWLRDAEPAPPAPVQTPPWGVSTSAAPANAPTADDDVPAWLRDAEPAPAAPAAPIRTPAPDDDVPAWLRDAEPAALPAARGPAEAVPTWLRDDVTDQEPPPAPLSDNERATAAGRDTGSGADNLPPWLTTDAAEPTAAPGSPPASDMSLPSWLRGVTDEPPAARPAARAPRGDEAPPARRGVSTREDAEGDDFFKGADLPSWLRPAEPELPAETPEGQALDWLTRLGAADEGESESSIGAPPALKTAAPQRPTYQRNGEQREAIALLGRLIRTPYPEPAAAPLPAALSGWQRVGVDRVLYLLLLLALLAGAIVPQLTAPLQTAAPASAGSAELSQLIAGLGPDDVVLMAYEWNAQRSAELRPLERAVTAQLIANKAKLILLSTDLQGTMLSFDQLGPLRAAGYNVDPDGTPYGGRDYVMLGYRPGGELALRGLAQDLRGQLRSDFDGNDASTGLLATNLDGSPRISGIADLSMIVVLADQPQDVQAWMEQVHSAAPGVPIAFLLPQEAEPIAQPYLRMPNVYHIAGRQGALAFGALAAGADTAEVARATGQQSLAALTFVILLIGGGLGAALARARTSRRGAA